MTRTTPISQRQLARELISFSLPICAVNLLFMVGNFFGVLLLSHLGKQYIAASALGFSTFVAITTITSTMFYGVSILVSHAKGADNNRQAGNVYKNALIVAVLFGIPGSLLLWHAASSILLVCGQNPALVNLTVGYFHYAAVGVIPVLMASCMSQFYVGIGRPKVFLVVNLIKLPFTLSIMYVAILGHFGHAQLGLGGITYATTVVQVITVMLMSLYLYFDQKISKYHVFCRKGFADIQVIKKIIKVGLPIGLQFGGELAAITLATYFMGYLGVDALAAGQIVSQYSLFGIMVMIGSSQALSVLVSGAYAKKDLALIKAYQQVAVKVLGVFFIIVAIIFTFGGHWLIKPYIHHGEHQQLISLCLIFFKLAAIYLCLDALRDILSATLRGLQQSQTPMLVGLSCIWGISIPLSYLLGLYWWQDPVLLRIGFMAGFFVAVIVLWQRLTQRIDTIRR